MIHLCLILLQAAAGTAGRALGGGAGAAGQAGAQRAQQAAAGSRPCTEAGDAGCRHWRRPAAAVPGPAAAPDAEGLLGSAAPGDCCRQASPVAG